MSCPDWSALIAARERDLELPEEAAARAHLASCRRCREVALRLDPTLVFTRLPAVPEAAIDVSAMRRDVAALVRAQRVEGGHGRSRRSWRRLAAAAALLIGVLALEPRRPAPTPAPATPLQALSSSTGEAAFALLDEVGLPDARVYELGTDGVAVVMVVDASLDV